jgi:hypothetical protein
MDELKSSPRRELTGEQITIPVVNESESEKAQKKEIKKSPRGRTERMKEVKTKALLMRNPVINLEADVKRIECTDQLTGRGIATGTLAEDIESAAIVILENMSVFLNLSNSPLPIN